MEWLLEQPQRALVHALLTASPRVVTSELSLLECERSLHRLTAAGRLPLSRAQTRRLRLEQVASSWLLVPLHSEVLERGKCAFPEEPVRSLDALHLATASWVRPMLPGLAILSLDDRIRANGPHLGLSVLPA